MKKLFLSLAIVMASIGVTEAKVSAAPNEAVTIEKSASKTPIDIEESVEPKFIGNICTVSVGMPYWIETFSGQELVVDWTVQCWSCNSCPSDVINVVFH